MRNIDFQFVPTLQVKGDGRRGEARRKQGAREELGRKSAEGTLRDWKCRTDEEESKRCGRRRRSLALSRPPACMQIETRGSAGRVKVLKQGKECPRHWRGRPRPPASLHRREGRRIYLATATTDHRRRRRRCCLLFLRKGNGGAKRSFITPPAAGATTTTARPTDRAAFSPPTSSTGRAAQWW